MPRDDLEQSLKAIDRELEDCLVTIENKEKMMREWKECCHKIESNKNFVIEEKDKISKKMSLDKGLTAYNCNSCKTTCEGPIMTKNKKRNLKQICDDCKCPAGDHEYQNFVYHQITEMTEKTMLNMKAEYESNCNDKLSVEQNLEKCLDDLNLAKGKVFSLLDQVAASANSLNSKALRSNALSPSDYLSLMRSRVNEKQTPGYLTRLETLTELQQIFETAISTKTEKLAGNSSVPQQKKQEVKSSQSSNGGNNSGPSKTGPVHSSSGPQWRSNQPISQESSTKSGLKNDPTGAVGKKDTGKYSVTDQNNSNTRVTASLIPQRPASIKNDRPKDVSPDEMEVVLKSKCPSGSVESYYSSVSKKQTSTRSRPKSSTEQKPVNSGKQETVNLTQSTSSSFREETVGNRGGGSFSAEKEEFSCDEEEITAECGDLKKQENKQSPGMFSSALSFFRSRFSSPT